MSQLYVCKEYETPYSEGYKVVRSIEEHNKIIYNQALEDALNVVEWDGYTLDIKKRIEQLKR